jgi:Methyltransferase domain
MAQIKPAPPAPISPVDLIPSQQFFAELYPQAAAHLASFSEAYASARDGQPGDENLKALFSTTVGVGELVFQAFGQTPPNTRPHSIADVSETFEAVAALCDRCPKRPAATVCATELRKLAAHLSSLSKTSAAQIARDQRISAHVLNVFFTAMSTIYRYIFDEFKWSTSDPRQATAFFDSDAASRSAPPQSAATIQKSQDQLEGWCSNAKAWLLYDLVTKAKPAIAVEVGIFGGRSLAVIAQALKDNRHGVVYGIETWSGSAAVRYRTGFTNDFWWQNIDFKKIKADFYSFFIQHGLLDVVKTIELPSEAAHQCLGEIDFLHIDGNHSMFGSSQDVINYYGKLKPGGYVVFDDIDWPSTRAGLEIIMDTAELVGVVPGNDKSTAPGCAAFRKV